MSVFFGLMAVLANAALCYGLWWDKKDWKAPSFLFRFFLAATILSALAALLSIILFDGSMGWNGSLSATIWLLLLVLWGLYHLFLFLGMKVASLSVLFFPYSLLLCCFAWGGDFLGARAIPSAAHAPSVVWFVSHIATSLISYGLLSWASLAALSCLLQAQRLEANISSVWLSSLPSIREAEHMEHNLLLAAVIAMFFAILSGFAAFHGFETALVKILLSLVAFSMALILYLMRIYVGVAGVRAARIILVAWFCLSLAWIGVKFVTEGVS